MKNKQLSIFNTSYEEYKKVNNMDSKEEKRWCYGCNETKPLTPEYWSWANKEHTRFRTKCRSCTNFDSKMSHRAHYKERKERELKRKLEVEK